MFNRLSVVLLMVLALGAGISWSVSAVEKSWFDGGKSLLDSLLGGGEEKSAKGVLSNCRQLHPTQGAVGANCRGIRGHGYAGDDLIDFHAGGAADPVRRRGDCRRTVANGRRLAGGVDCSHGPIRRRP